LARRLHQSRSLRTRKKNPKKIFFSLAFWIFIVNLGCKSKVGAHHLDKERKAMLTAFFSVRRVALIVVFALAVQLGTGNSVKAASLSLANIMISDTDTAPGATVYTSVVGIGTDQLTITGHTADFAFVLNGNIQVTSNSPGTVGQGGQLTINDLQVTRIDPNNLGNAAKTLTVAFSDTGFAFPLFNPITVASSANGLTLSGFGGNPSTSDSATFQGWAGVDTPANPLGVLFDMGAHSVTPGSMTTSSPATVGGGVGSAGFPTSPLVASTPFDRTAGGGIGYYSLTDVLQVTLVNIGDQGSVTATTSTSAAPGSQDFNPAPEPASLALFGIGLGLAGFGWQRRRKETVQVAV
jgi:hypothetical protein